MPWRACSRAATPREPSKRRRMNLRGYLRPIRRSTRSPAMSAVSIDSCLEPAATWLSTPSVGAYRFGARTSNTGRSGQGWLDRARAPVYGRRPAMRSVALRGQPPSDEPASGQVSAEPPGLEAEPNSDREPDLGAAANAFLEEDPASRHTVISPIAIVTATTASKVRASTGQVSATARMPCRAGFLLAIPSFREIRHCWTSVT